MRTISLKCKDCNGTLDISEDQEIIFCPYCGSKNLIIESDEVKIERIKAENKRQMAKDRYENEKNDTYRRAAIMLLAPIVGILIMIILHKILFG